MWTVKDFSQIMKVLEYRMIVFVFLSQVLVNFSAACGHDAIALLNCFYE